MLTASYTFHPQTGTWTASNLPEPAAPPRPFSAVVFFTILIGALSIGGLTALLLRKGF